MATFSQRRARQHGSLLGSGLGLASRASKLGLPLLAAVALSACADVETPAAATEKNPFELAEPAPTRRVAQVKIALRSQAKQAAGPQLRAKPSDAVKSGDEPSGAAGPVESESLMAPSIDLAQDTIQARSQEDVEQAKQSPVHSDNPLALKVRGDFAAFRGVQERLVWAFAGVSAPVWTSLQVGDCIGVSGSAQRAPELNAAEAQGTREIELLDLGRFEIELGDQRFEVPLHLAPGVLPYASGVQYRGEQEVPMPSEADLALGWQGVRELPGSRFSTPVPPKLNFELYPSESDQGEDESTWYDMVWTPAKAEAKSRLYLHARLSAQDLAQGQQQQAGQVVCRLPDRGEWQLDLEELADEGLDINAEDRTIEFELRRVRDFSTSAPGFERVQVQVERSESLRLGLNAE